MKTKDRIKEEIGLHKLLMTIASAMFSSVAGWMFNNSNAVLSVKLICVFLVMMTSLVAVIFFLSQINIKIKELDYE